MNWLQVLHLPPSAHMPTESQFKYFIECSEAIKDEFPGTSIAQAFMVNAMDEFRKEQRTCMRNWSPCFVMGMVQTM